MMRQNQDRPHHSARSSAQAVPFDQRFLERSSRWLRDEEIRHFTLTPSFTRDQQLAMAHLRTTRRTGSCRRKRFARIFQLSCQWGRNYRAIPG